MWKNAKQKGICSKKMQLCRVLKSTFVLNMLREYVHTSNLARNHDFLLPGELKLYFKKAKK